MKPCPHTLCERGEAIVCAVSGFQMLGVSCDVTLVHKFMVSHNGYNEDCSVNWQIMNALDFPQYNNFTDPQYNQICFWARTLNPVVVTLPDPQTQNLRSGLIVNCNDMGDLYVRDGNMTFFSLPFNPSFEYLVFLSETY